APARSRRHRLPDRALDLYRPAVQCGDRDRQRADPRHDGGGLLGRHRPPAQRHLHPLGRCGALFRAADRAPRPSALILTGAIAMTPFVSTRWLAERLDDPDIVIVDASWHLPNAGRDAKA